MSRLKSEKSSVHALLWHAYFRVQGFDSYWSQLENYFGGVQVDQEQELASRLLDQLKHFGTRKDAVPEWKDASGIGDPADLPSIWADLPILTKDDLRGRFHPDNISPLINLPVVKSATGGSTGEPTPFLRDSNTLKAAAASSAYSHMKMGWSPGTPIVALWGSERDIGKQRSLRARISSKLRNAELVDGYQMDSSTVDRLLQVLERHRSVALYGFTSMLEFAARELLSRGYEPVKGKVRTAWNGGETLHDFQSDLFKQAFGVPILNLYGGRELGAIAFQPGEGQSLHVLRPFLVVEVLDAHGRPAAPGEVGRLVVTSTLCKGTPFLRYDIGDLGYVEAGDGDAFGVRKIQSVVGRQAGLFELPNGKKLHSLYWNHLFKDYPEISQFQVALIGGDHLELRLRGRQMTPEREHQLLAVLRKVAGQLTISIKWVDKIPLTAQGKLLQAVIEP